MCGKPLTQRGMQYHLKNKVCENKQKYLCLVCDTELSSKQRLDQHIKNNACEKKIKNPKRSKLKLRPNKSTIINQNAQTIVNGGVTINIIVPLKFLDSAYDYEWLNKHKKNILFNTVRYHPADPIRHFIEETIANVDMPIFNSIRVKNDKESIIEVSDGVEYICASKKQAIKDLIERIRDILQEYKDSDNKIPRSYWEKCDEYLVHVDDYSSEQMKDLRVEIIVMLLNLRKKMLTEEWEKKLKAQLDWYKNLPDINDDDNDDSDDSDDNDN